MGPRTDAFVDSGRTPGRERGSGREQVSPEGGTRTLLDMLMFVGEWFCKLKTCGRNLHLGKKTKCFQCCWVRKRKAYVMGDIRGVQGAFLEEHQSRGHLRSDFPV
jgi:hypothetical protein